MTGYFEINIRFDNKEVIASVGKSVAKGIAKCHPDDEFDLQIGINLAVSRLLDSMKMPSVGDPTVFDGKLKNVNDFMWAREHLDADQMFRYAYTANPSPDLIYILLGHDEKYGVIEEHNTIGNRIFILPYSELRAYHPSFGLF